MPSNARSFTAAALFCGLTATLAITAPLLTYVLSLALFGFVHVFSELRYVDLRFRARLSTRMLGFILAPLGLIVLLRITRFFEFSASLPGSELELLLVALLATVAFIPLVRTGLLPATVAAFAALTCVAGLLWAPALLLTVLALLHNLTPVGFLAERLRGRERRRALGACLVAFLIVPAMILVGGAESLLESLYLLLGNVEFLASGPLDSHLPVFVPAALLERPIALNLFRAAVYLQCLHYAVTIHVLPRLVDDRGGSSLANWPPASIFTRALFALGALSLGLFALSFHDARKIYGVFAAFHAWIEIPILLLSVGGFAAWARSDRGMDHA